MVIPSLFVFCVCVFFVFLATLMDYAILYLQPKWLVGTSVKKPFPFHGGFGQNHYSGFIHPPHQTSRLTSFLHIMVFITTLSWGGLLLTSCPGVHFIKVKRRFWCLMTLFWHSKRQLSNKNATFWHFKCQKCFMKLHKS